MSRRIPALVVAVAILILAAPATAESPAVDGASPAAVPDHAEHEVEIVSITARRLHPTVNQIPATSSFGWLNYSGQNASIIFEDPEIVSKMRCTTPGTFRVEADQLAAPLIRSGEAATLCHLAPGEYDYRVELPGRDKPLLGRLVVSAGGVAPRPAESPERHPEAGRCVVAWGSRSWSPRCADPSPC